MASPLTRQVVQDPNAGSALQAPQPVSLAPVSLPTQRPATQAADNVNAALGKLGDIISEQIKDRQDKAVLDGQEQWLAGKSEEEMRKSGDYYTEQGYQGLKIVNDTDVWYNNNVNDLDNQVQLSPDDYNKHLSEQRNTYLDSIKDPTLKQAAISRLAELSPRLVQMQMQKASDYQKQQFSGTFGKTLKTVASNGLDTPRQVPGSPLAVSATPIASALSLTPQDRDTMIRTVMGEAGGEGDQGMAAVALVMRNRLEDGSYGKTMRDVALAPKQFSVWNGAGPGEGPARFDMNSDQYKKAAQIVDAVTSGRVADMTNGATHYYAPNGMQDGKAPAWYHDLAQASGNRLEIGNHIFTGRAKNVQVDTTKYDETSAIQDTGQDSKLAIPSSANISKVDPRIVRIMQLAANDWDGKAEITAKGGNNGRAAGTTNHSSGRAVDIQLYDPQGKPIKNYQDGAGALQYQKFANRARQIQMQLYPELKDAFRWGGYFSGKGYGGLDSMHFDIVGAGMAGGSWDTGFTDTQKQMYGITDNVGLGAYGSDAQHYAATGVGGPPNTQVVRLFNNQSSSVKWDAAKDQIVSDLAQGDYTLLNSFGGINALPALKFSPDQVKAVYEAAQRADKARNNQWNLGRHKEVEQLVANVEQGADKNDALQQLDGWVKQGYFDDESAKALANRIETADAKHKNDVQSQELNTPAAQQAQLDIREKMRKSVVEGDASYTPEVAWRELATKGLSEKVQGSIRASLASSFEGFMQTRRANEPYDPNKAMTDDQLMRAAQHGAIDQAGIVAMVNKLDRTPQQKAALSNNLLAARRAFDEKKATNPDFDPVKFAKIDDIKNQVDNGMPRDVAIAELAKLGLSDTQMSSAASEVAGRARAWETKNRPDPLLNPELIQAYSPIYNLMQQANVDADKGNDVHYTDKQVQWYLNGLKQRFNLSQDQMDKLNEKFRAADEQTANEYQKRVEAAAVIAAQNKRTQDAVNQGINRGDISGLDKFQFSGKDPFTQQDTGTINGTQLAINTLKSQAAQQASAMVDAQSKADPTKRDQFAAQAKQTAFQTVHRILAKSGVADEDTKREFNSLRGDIVGKDGNISPEARAAFDDYRQMRNDPQMGKDYANKYVPDDLALFMEDAYNGTTGYNDSENALKQAAQRRQDQIKAKYNDANTAIYQAAAKQEIDTVVNDRFGKGWVDFLIGRDNNGVSRDDAAYLQSEGNMNTLKTIVEGVAADIHMQHDTYSAKDVATVAADKVMKSVDMVHGNVLIGDINSNRPVSALLGLEPTQLGPAIDKYLWDNQDKFGQWQGGGADTEGLWHRGLTARAAGSDDPYALGSVAGNKINGYIPNYTVTYLKSSNQFRVDIFVDPERTRTTANPITIDAKALADDYKNYLAHPSWYQKLGDTSIRSVGKAWNYLWEGTKDEGTSIGPAGNL